MIYGTFDHMIYRPDGTSPRGLPVFGAAFFTTSGRVEQDHSFELGLVLAARTRAGGSTSIPREELMFELNYGLEVSPAMRLTPNLQYVLNPDQASMPALTRNIRDAFVIGGRVTVDLTEVAKRSAF